MSLLEFIGLEYLLGDNDPLGLDSVENPLGVILGIVGFVVWFIIGTVDGRYQDLSIAVWNLVPAIVLLVLLIVRVVLSMVKHAERKKVIFNIINLAVSACLFIYGLSHPYLSLLAEHEYYPFWSGVAYTLWPNFIFLILYNVLFNSYYNSLGSKILFIPKGIGIFILVFLYIVFVGQVFSTVFYFTGHKDFYNHFAYYHKIVYNDKRKEYNISSIEDFLNDRYKLAYEFYEKKCKELYPDLKGKEYEDSCRKYQEGTFGNLYIETLNNTTKKDFGYYISRFHHIGDSYKDVIMVVDKEWNKASYYILDRSNYSVKKTTKKYYEEVKKQNNK